MRGVKEDARPEGVVLTVQVRDDGEEFDIGNAEIILKEKNN
jgi:hypothetical protein